MGNVVGFYPSEIPDIKGKMSFFQDTRKPKREKNISPEPVLIRQLRIESSFSKNPRPRFLSLGRGTKKIKKGGS